MGGASAPSHVTQSQTSDVPPWLKPYITYFTDVGTKSVLGGGLVQNPDGSFSYQGDTGISYGGPEQTVVPFTPDEIAARQAMSSYLQSPLDPRINQTLGMLGDTLSGKYLDPNQNPYLKETADLAAGNLTRNYNDVVAPQEAAQAALSGTYGGTNQTLTADMSRYALGQNLAELENSIYGGNYQEERNRMMTAAQLAPGIASGEDQMMINRLQQLKLMGFDTRQLEQQMVDVQYQNALTAFQFPQQQLSWLGNLLGGIAGHGGTTTTVAPNPNATSTAALYGGLGAAGTASLLAALRASGGGTA